MTKYNKYLASLEPIYSTDYLIGKAQGLDHCNTSRLPSTLYPERRAAYLAGQSAAQSLVDNYYEQAYQALA
jgi:hypothetical protein